MLGRLLKLSASVSSSVKWDWYSQPTHRIEDRRADEYKGMIDIQQISAELLITIDTVHTASNVVRVH